MVIVFTLAVFSRLTVAQDSRFEVFGGYSLEHIAICGHSAGGCGGLESGDLPAAMTFNGWDAAFTIYLSKNLGITTDFSGHYKSVSNGTAIPSERLSRFSYMFGPTFPLHLKLARSTPFLHLLFGGARAGPFSSNMFNTALGGGWDIKLKHHVSVRLVQAEYELTIVPRSSAGTGIGYANGFRYSGGIVIR
jgi:hypothetical protein